MSTKNITYEEALRQLTRIVDSIEQGDVPLEELGPKIKDAQQLLKTCKDKLTRAEKDVQKALGDGER